VVLKSRCTRYEQLSLLYQAFWLAMCWVVPSLLYVLLAQCNGACGACDWSFESGLALDQVGQDYWRLLGARIFFAPTKTAAARKDDKYVHFDEELDISRYLSSEDKGLDDL
jgi:hypothetical protein